MYGLGIIKGLGVTMKNLASPGRQFNLHQYPDKKASPSDLAKLDGRNTLAFMFSKPIKTLKSLAGLETIEQKLPRCQV